MPKANTVVNKVQIDSKEIIKQFLLIVRSGKQPERATEFMHDTVLAHQVLAEKETTVKRTPANYTRHIQDFKKAFGDYRFEILELMAEKNKVYVRWKQTGKHIGEYDGYPPTNLELTEITSVVYHLKDGKISSYWLQTDRFGFDFQLRNNQKRISTEK